MSNQEFEYRVHWEAASNHTFRGESDWIEFGYAESESDVETALESGGGVCDGLAAALEASGFGWWIEVRRTPDPQEER